MATLDRSQGPMTVTREGRVEVLERRKKAHGRTRVQRLYRCGNGLSLGAVTGGPLDLGDDERPWEIFLFNPQGVVYDRMGFVSDEDLVRAVELLDSWLDRWPEPITASP
jgi:hypothetical protein